MPKKPRHGGGSQRRGDPAPAPVAAVAVEAPAEERASSPDALPHVVAIGASAGGLAALKTFFAHVPPDGAVAYVVVMHLSPEYESHLDELLQPHIKMPVHQVKEPIGIEKDRVYVIPPNFNLEVTGTQLRLRQLEPGRHLRAPVDHFFCSLADAFGDHATGIVLSGTGSDGAIGLRRIKECGGLAVVQDPAEAEYDGMPRNAVADGLVDLVLPLEKIPHAVLRYAQTKPRLPVPAHEQEDAKGEARQFLQKVVAQVRARTGRDFSHYKQATLLRRIARRMQFTHLQEAIAYLALLRADPGEVKALADDFLITVTSFFRDAEMFEILERDVVPRLFDGKGPGDTVRVWSVGCATGEEAYSLAILLLQEADRRGSQATIQVFATDLHTQALEKARAGFYSDAVEADVGPERLQRFFRREDNGYRVLTEVREHVVFTPHDVLADPPFSRLDLISCRNLFIYLERDLYQQLTALLHYALKPDGFLVLGTSEAVGETELFQVESKQHAICRKRNVPAIEPRLPVFSLAHAQAAGRFDRPAPVLEPMAYGALHQRLVEQYAPPSVLVNPDDHVVHFSAHAGRYVVQPGGTPTTNVLKLVRDELRAELRTALSEARAQRKAIRTRPIPVRLDGDASSVVLDVRPALGRAQEGFILLIFDERPVPAPEASPTGDEAGAPGAAGASHETLRELQAERDLAEQRLQGVINDYETSKENLRASNEELLSANEELRSTLEELETSKEELQSINEELQTVNQENRHRVEELGQLSSDLQNLFAATDIATLFLDRDLRILRYTPKTGELFNVQPTDRGRPLSDLTHRLGYDKLGEDALQVLDRLVPVEREVRGAGRYFQMTLRPYRDVKDRIAGVVVTFVDLTVRKEMEEALREAKEYAENIIETLPEPLLVLTPDLMVQSANAAFYAHFKVGPGETSGRKIYDLGNSQWDIPALRKLLEEVLPANKVFNGYLVDHVFESIGRRVMVMNGRRLEHMQLILLGISDVTERHDAKLALEAANARLRDSDRRKNEFLAVLSHELRNPLAPIKNSLHILGRSAPGGEQARRAQAVVARQFDQLVRLTDDLLDMTRVTTGKVHLQRERLELDDLVRRSVEDHRPMFDAAGVRLELAPARAHLFISGDGDRLAQVVGNLLQNAAKFTPPEGRVTVTVSEEAGGRRAALRVADTGPGMTPEVLARLYEPFAQADRTLDRSKGGLGLGLALVKRLVELHGGEVTASSAGPGQGSEFTVHLPLVEKQPEEPPPPDRRALSLPRRRVLVIEDNHDAADSLRELLEFEHQDVAVAYDGPEGIAKARSFRPDVVLCDIGLPGMNGYDVARAFRADAALGGAFLVALTGYALSEDLEQAAAAGFDQHLVKPPDLEKLERVLNGVPAPGRGD